MYSLRVQEARILKSRCRQAHTSLWSLWERIFSSLFHLLVAAGILWLVTTISVPVATSLSPLCVRMISL